MSLPVETWDHIISYLRDKRDLQALCMTSPMLLTVTQRYLYRDITLRSAKTIVKLHNVLSQKPQLARFVLYVHQVSPDSILHEFWIMSGRSKGVFMTGYIRMVFLMLRKLIRVQKLEFSNFIRKNAGWRPDIDPGLANLTTCPFKLDNLVLASRRSSIGTAFFKAQPFLKDIEMRTDFFNTGDYDFLDDLQDKPGDILPVLSKICADVNLAVAVVPYRPVETLTIMGDLDPAALFTLAPTLALSRGPLQNLSLELVSVTADVLRALFTCLEHLMQFSVSFEDQNDPSEVMAAFEAFAEDGTLRKMKSFASLHIDVERWPSLDQEDHMMPNICRLGDGCPTLRFVRLSTMKSGMENCGLSNARMGYHRERNTDNEGQESVRGWRREIEEFRTLYFAPHISANEVDENFEDNTP